MTPSTSFLSFVTSATRSPLRIVEFSQSALCNVFDTTYFGIVFIFWAKPTLSERLGHAAAKPSYVRRPRSCASASSTSSSLNASPSSPRSNSKVQPPCLYSSPPPGASITPSREMNSVTTMFPTGPLYRRSVRTYVRVRRDDSSRRHRLVLRVRRAARRSPPPRTPGDRQRRSRPRGELRGKGVRRPHRDERAHGSPAVSARSRRSAPHVGVHRGEQGGLPRLRRHDAGRRGPVDRRGVPGRPRHAPPRRWPG